MNLGRDKLPWKQELWDRIDQAVHAEAERIKVAARFLPMQGPLPEALTVPADTIDPQAAAGEPLTVDESAVTQMLEIWVEFALTKPQVEREEELATAVTLATRATNLLAQAQDLLIFQGANALTQPMFIGNQVRLRTRPNSVASLLRDDPFVVVEAVAIDQGRARYSESTASAAARAYGMLQNLGHYGPYALILDTADYSDTYEPLQNTLIMPADRIKPLVTQGFFGTGTLQPENGVFVSLGGNTMDLVVGTAPITAFVQEDSQGRSRFRVFERFALRLKDPTAIVRLRFEPVEEAIRRRAGIAVPQRVNAVGGGNQPPADQPVGGGNQPPADQPVGGGNQPPA
jgi:uncharacterized linocin/CFP29 family protein